MLVNIHSHQNIDTPENTVLNLNLTAAEKVFNTNKSGYFSAGIHPWEANEFSNEKIILLEKIINDDRFVFIGECGLDKKCNIAYQQQLFVFRQQIELSESAKKPLLIHCVGYFNELFEIKKKLLPEQRWIIHGFRGKPQLAQQALQNGCSLSFGEHFNEESVKVTPIDKLFVETDESNINIDEIYSRVSQIKLCKPTDLNAGHLLVNANNKQNKL